MSFLSDADLDTVIRLAPLIAIDLIIRNAQDEVLLGLRKNEPAKGCYFVPGGRILKNERLAEAFARLIKNETDHAARLDDARLIGVYEHFYNNNRSGNGGYGTHHVVFGYEFRWPAAAVPRPDDQHSELRWWPVAELLASDRVHENAKAYFRYRVPTITALVDRFLAWPLPQSVCSDLCVSDANYPHSRCGTNLLTATEARQMIEYLLAPAGAE